MIPNVSFGQKIPFAVYSVYNKQKQQSENVEMYRLDCTDKQDVYEVMSAPNIYMYTDQIASLMDVQHMYYETKKMMPPDIWEKYFTDDEPTCAVYVTKNEDDEVIGICQTGPAENSEMIEFIETNHHGVYKYIGQGMIASIAKKLLKQNKEEISIYRPVKSAKGFYEKCGFNVNHPEALTAKKEDLQNIVDTYESKVGKKIIGFFYLHQ